MGIFAISQNDITDAVQEAHGWINRGRWLFPYTALIPPDPDVALFLMEWTTSYELRKLTVSYSRTPSSGVVQDAAMTTHHFLNITDGIPDSSWTTADYTAVESAFDTFWGALSSNYYSGVKLSEYVWRADGPTFRPFGSSLSPTLRRTARSLAGSATEGSLPPQCAVSVTETTAAKYTVENVEGVGTQIRNRWGRFYLPAPKRSLSGDGWIGGTFPADVANAAQAMYNTCTAAGLVPVVYSPTTGHAWSVLEIHVDDIFDVIRSRRYVTPNTRSARAINQP